MRANLGKRSQRIQKGNDTAQLIYSWLRQLPAPSDAMNVLCSVHAMMVMQCHPKDGPLDEGMIRVMMGEMTNNVVTLILGEEDGASSGDRGLSSAAPGNDTAH